MIWYGIVAKMLFVSNGVFFLAIELEAAYPISKFDTTALRRQGKSVLFSYFPAPRL